MNSKIQVIPFNPMHLKMIDLKENYPLNECPTTVVTNAFTLMQGETVIAILGGFPFVPGVIHFWAIIAKQVRECPIAFHKECIKILDWYEQHEKPRRIQWEVKADYLMGCKWAESLGMKREGLMKAWGPDGSDHYLYARVNPCQP